jgi:uncharacterized protein
MNQDFIVGVLEALDQIGSDDSVPKNVRIRIKNASLALGEAEKSIAVRVDKSLQELEEITEDPNIPSYTRTMIWNVVSQLERMS